MTTQTAPLKTLFDCFTHGGRQSEKCHRYIEPGGEVICRCCTYSEMLEDGR